jgi:hypothetical protein
MSTFPGSRPRPASPPLPPAPPYREGSASPAAGQERRRARSVAGRRDPGRNAPGRVDGQTGPATGSEGAGGAVDQAAGTGRAGGRLGGQPEGDEHPTHGVGLRHRAQDPARAPAALTDQHLDRKHPSGAAGTPVHRPGDRAPVAARASSGELGSPAGLGSRYIPHSPAAMMPRPAPRRCATDRAPHARGSRLPPRPRPGRGASPGTPLPWGWGRRTSWIDAEATPHHPVFLRSGRVVVEAPGQLDEHAGLVAHRPGVMPRGQHHDVVRTKLILGPIIHDHMQAA